MSKARYTNKEIMKRVSNRKKKQSWYALDMLIAQAVTCKMTGKDVQFNRILATVQHKNKVVYHKFAIWILNYVNHSEFILKVDDSKALKSLKEKIGPARYNTLLVAFKLSGVQHQKAFELVEI